MAKTKVVNLRLPESLSERLSQASENSGVPKNSVFNDAVAGAIDGNHVERHEKPKYVHTCVRLPADSYDAVKNMAYGEFLTINTMLVKILHEHFGVDSCVAEEGIQ